MLLLHGLPGQATAWDKVAPRLVRAGYRTLLPDLLGFGASEAPSDVSLDAQADAVALLLRSLDLRSVHILAHDFGLPVALTLHRRHPQVRIASLVAAAGNLFPDTPIPAPLKVAAVPVLRWLLWPLLGTVPGARLVFRLASGHPPSATPRIDRRSARTTFRLFSQSLGDLPGLYAPVERSARLLRVPTVVVWGTKDPFFPVALGRRTAEALGAELVLVDGAGHFLPEECPEALVQALLRVVAPRADPSRRSPTRPAGRA